MISYESRRDVTTTDLPPAVHATDRQHAGRPWVGGFLGLWGAGMFGECGIP